MMGTIRVSVLGLVFLLAGCASVPDNLAGVPERYPSPDEVAANPAAHEGDRVRWGGRIVAVENGADSTWISVLAQPLQANARPSDADGTARFMAHFDGFRDPMVYKTGKSLTVVGRVAGVREAAIGDFSYAYPVVDVQAEQLWKPLPDPVEAPYYYPGYPPGWGPYWYPHDHWHRYPGYW